MQDVGIGLWKVACPRSALFLVWCHPYILLHFYTLVSLLFLYALTVARGEMAYALKSSFALQGSIGIHIGHYFKHTKRFSPTDENK